jgi:2-polyprenyl-3-methyl-5-hydroxy-6-metoxy-1,4-benzoquinol methylase
LLANTGQVERTNVQEVDDVDVSKSWELISFEDVARHTQPLLATSSSTTTTTTTTTTSSSSASSVCDDAALHWDRFYAEKQDTFFPTRHYLHHAFPELLGRTPTGPPGIVALRSNDDEPLRNPELAVLPQDTSVPDEYNYGDRLARCGIGAAQGAVLLEAGCGTGSSLYSLAELLPNVRCAGCDLSQHAIDLVRRNPRFTADRIHGFVWDSVAP